MSDAGTVLHGCPARTIRRCNCRVQAPIRRVCNVCVWWSSRTRRAARDGVRRAALPRDSTFLEGMDREIKIQGQVARDGQPFRPNVEAADQPGAWIADCSADISPPRRNWRSAKLGPVGDANESTLSKTVP